MASKGLAIWLAQYRTGIAAPLYTVGYRHCLPISGPNQAMQEARSFCTLCFYGHLNDRYLMNRKYKGELQIMQKPKCKLNCLNNSG
jgi:hypothetical protein